MNNHSFELRLYSALEKIFPHNAAPTHTKQINLSGLQDETISFQIAYKLPPSGYRTWGRLKVNAPNNLPITLRRIRYVPGSLPQHFQTDDNYLSKETGVFPDLLENMDANHLPLIPGIWQTMWVDIDILPTHQGRFAIHIQIENESGETLDSGDAIIDTIPAALPPLDIPHTRWFHVDCLATYYEVDIFSERHWQIIENFAAYAVQHSINTLLTPIFTPPLDTAIGGERPTVQLIDVTVRDNKYVFDFKKLERWVAMCKRIGVQFYEMSHLFTQWGAKHAPKIIDTAGQRLFGWETDATGPAYTAFLQQLLPALTAELIRLGIAQSTLFHISDEPGLESLAQYTAARNIVEPYLQGYKIVDALTDYDFYKTGCVSVPIPAVNHIEPFLAGNVPELWCYYCCAQSAHVPNLFFMQPSFRNRILGVLLYKYDIAGFLHWGYNFYNSMHSIYPINPFVVTDADGAFPSGDAFIVYPGEKGQPLGSVRLAVAQEAFFDLRALRLLEQLAGRDFVLGLIDEGLAEPITFSSFPQNAEYVLALRQRVNEEISKRQ